MRNSIVVVGRSVVMYCKFPNPNTNDSIYKLTQYRSFQDPFWWCTNTIMTLAPSPVCVGGGDKLRLWIAVGGYLKAIVIVMLLRELATR